jgi:hypothetical protein
MLSAEVDARLAEVLRVAGRQQGWLPDEGHDHDLTRRLLPRARHCRRARQP